jgi:choline dehydrogenase
VQELARRTDSGAPSLDLFPVEAAEEMSVTREVLEFDHVVIGAGSSGSTLVRRLVDAGRRVAVIEAGGSDLHPDIQTPNRMFKTWGSDFDWKYVSVPQEDGTVVELPRGRVLGGSSSLYGMVYARGVAADYDNWAYNGAPGWSWRDVLPYFLKSEDYEGGASEYHGAGGPMPVTHAPHPNPLTELFVEASSQYGLAKTKDSNGPEILGAGTGSLNIKDGRRFSSWTSFVEPILGDPLLTVLTESLVTRLLIEDGVCVGAVVRRDGRELTVRSLGEVMLAAGTFGSAQILQLSGIGPADDLRALGVDVLVDLPGVGSNLHDHVLAPIVFEALQPLEEPRLNYTEGHFFAESEPGMVAPDLQPIFVPASLPLRAGRSVPEQAFTMLAGVIRPLSRGRMWLRSADPEAAPAIDPAYFREPQDVRAMLAAIEMCREIVAQPAFDGARGAELSPGADISSADELERYMREQVLSYHHHAGTCRMGQDARSVVDPQLRVHGVAGLRIADCSVIPAVPSSNTHAAAVMIGERAADFVLQG